MTQQHFLYKCHIIKYITGININISQVLSVKEQKRQSIIIKCGCIIVRPRRPQEHESQSGDIIIQGMNASTTLTSKYCWPDQQSAFWYQIFCQGTQNTQCRSLSLQETLWVLTYILTWNIPERYLIHPSYNDDNDSNSNSCH